jgi:uncharacterized protein (TIGR02246 family)
MNMIPKLITLICLVGSVAVSATWAGANDAEERAIRQVIEQRRLAWNAEDTQTYAGLLTEDADNLSSTGQSAYGRDGIIKLYLEQRAGAYRGAMMTSTVVARIKFVRPDVALADAEAELVGARGRDGNPTSPTKVLVIFILSKEHDRWRISSIRGMPVAAIQAPRQ